MKFARLVYGYNNMQLKGKQYINVGDYFQTFALDNLYEYMGIAEENIITVRREELSKYSGEKIILIMQGWYGYIKGIEVFPLPNSIKPIFWGYHCITKHNYQDLACYTNNQPIGCRDERTYLLMKSKNIEAFLSGCLTLTLPRRKVEPSIEKVFLVDTPEGIENYLPDKYKYNIEYVTQEILINPKKDKEEEIIRVEAKSREILDKYKKEATLVITSRLHCASPCLAMGIPVILARKYFDERYMWIDKYIPLYTPDNFSTINWDASVIDLEDMKKRILDTLVSCIYNEINYDEINAIHNHFMNRNRENIHTPLMVRSYLKLHEKFPRTADFIREVVLQKYAIATGRHKANL